MHLSLSLLINQTSNTPINITHVSISLLPALSSLDLGLFGSEALDDMDGADGLEERLYFCEVRLPGGQTHRPQSILQSLQVLVLVYYEQSVQPWCLQENELALG
jgi:hypothetical protein